MVELSKNCCGCTCCAEVCPQGAIRMAQDEGGFLYPKIDTAKCIDCRLCEQKCPLRKPQNTGNAKPPTYAALSREAGVRVKSSSGGLFYMFASSVIRKGGVVFGAALSDDRKTVFHTYAESYDDLAKLQGSKYVQSDLSDIFKKVHFYLNHGRWVLFTGTMCQIEGLRSYLGKEYDKLILIDVICHGVPSPLIWGHYVHCKEASYSCKVQEVYFRDKTDGWKCFGMKLLFANGQCYRSVWQKDAYGKLFTANKIFRDSCEDCRFKSVEKNCDLSIGDLWGAEYMANELDDDMGVSLLMVHSKKGMDLLESIRDNLEIREIDFDAAVNNNPYILKSIKKGSGKAKQRIYKEIRAGKDIETIASKYAKNFNLKKYMIALLDRIGLLGTILNHRNNRSRKNG